MARWKCLRAALITLRLYGEVGALTVAETVSGRVGDRPAPHLTQSRILPSCNRERSRCMVPVGRVLGCNDDLPTLRQISRSLTIPSPSALGEMTLPFRASDDYGVEAGEARITLDLGAVDRRHGLALDPDARAPVTVSLPMPIAGRSRVNSMKT